MKVGLKQELTFVMLWAWAALVWPVAAAEPARHEEVRQVMGTLATVRVWADDKQTARAATDVAFAVFAEVDSLMSTWRDDSPLSRLNTAPKDVWVPVGREICQVLAAALEAARHTGGAFDPTVLPLVKLWGFRGGRPAVPDSQVLAAALARVDVQAVEVDGDRARLRKSGMGVDLGGIAKGHALDRAAEAMNRTGARGGVLDLGGNLLVFGAGPGNEVGVVDPDDRSVLALTIPLSAGSVATSGQYERFVTVGGRSFGHILDPRTGWPVPAGLSATVVAPRALWADALATAVVVLGVEEGLALLEGTPGVEGVVISSEGARMTSGFMAGISVP